MAIVTFMQSMPGRVLRVVGGALLLWVGSREASMAGLLLMMIAFIPIVTAIANICPMAGTRDVVARVQHREHPIAPRR